MLKKPALPVKKSIEDIATSGGFEHSVVGFVGPGFSGFYTQGFSLPLSGMQIPHILPSYHKCQVAVSGRTESKVSGNRQHIEGRR